jgi:hypothetical protein
MQRLTGFGVCELANGTCCGTRVVQQVTLVLSQLGRHMGFAELVLDWC